MKARMNTDAIKGNTGHLPMIRTVSEANISQGTPKMKHPLLNSKGFRKIEIVTEKMTQSR